MWEQGENVRLDNFVDIIQNIIITIIIRKKKDITFLLVHKSTRI